MKIVSKITLSIAVASSIFFAGCQSTVSEESLGLRKTNLYSEGSETIGDKTKYNTAAAGSSKMITRAFQDAPPMIPHSVEGMLPITIKNNVCISCHAPAVAAAVHATPYPASHMTNFRPSSYAVSGANTSSETLANISIKKEGKLVGARFNCSQCHAPQSEGQLVENTFEADFTSANGANRSSWNGSKFMEDVSKYVMIML
jgi:cytochrome c-type protein NapB